MDSHLTVKLNIAPDCSSFRTEFDLKLPDDVTQEDIEYFECLWLGIMRVVSHPDNVVQNIQRERHSVRVGDEMIQTLRVGEAWDDNVIPFPFEDPRIGEIEDE